MRRVRLGGILGGGGGGAIGGWQGEGLATRSSVALAVCVDAQPRLRTRVRRDHSPHTQIELPPLEQQRRLEVLLDYEPLDVCAGIGESMRDITEFRGEGDPTATAAVGRLHQPQVVPQVLIL